MTNQTKEVVGIVSKIKSNRKSLTINGTWYNSFTILNEDLSEGDKVKVIFSEKAVGDKIFNNIKSIELIGSESKEIENKDNVKSKESTETIKPLRDSTTINNLAMCSKDIFIAMEGKKSLKDVTTDVIASYKQIIENISK